MRTYFLGQAACELGVPFPLVEWGHGSDGVKELLTDLLGFTEVDKLLRFLELLGRKVIKGHWPCPCGSRRALRACHQDMVRRLCKRLSLETRRFLLAQARDHLLKGNGVLAP